MIMLGKNVKYYYYLALLICCLNWGVQAQVRNLNFQSYSTSEGLSSSTCVEVFQDSKGFLWFGTIDGLNRFDGYSFKIYRSIINDSTSLSNNRVFSIEEDKFGNLWVGTMNGLNILLKGKESFYRVKLYKSGAYQHSSQEIINDVSYDSLSNTIWVATKNGVSKASLDVLEQGAFEDLKFINHINDPNNSKSLDQNDVSRISIDNQGEVWLVTVGDNLHKYNSLNGSFERVSLERFSGGELDHLPKALLVDSEGKVWVGNNLSQLTYLKANGDFEELSISDVEGAIYDLFEDQIGQIWVATASNGIYVLDIDGKLKYRIYHIASNPYSLPKNQTSKILQDKDGIYWIATYNEGVAKLDMLKGAFGHSFYKESKVADIQIAQSVLQDSKGKIWIGTDGAGLSQYDPVTGDFKLYVHDPKNPNSLSSNKILFLANSYDGTIWVCTLDRGLNNFDPETGRFEVYKRKNEDLYSISQNSVWTALEDDKKRLWLGTREQGLNMLNLETGLFNSFVNVPSDSTSIIGNYVFSLFLDSKERLLIGTSVGMCWTELNKNGQGEKQEFHKVKHPNITGNLVNDIIEDHRGDIWVGTDLGFHHLTSDFELIKTYSTVDGVPNNLVIGIEEDDQNRLWLITKEGISRFDPETESFENFNMSDGLQGMEYQSKSITKLVNGKILAGGINGFNLFDPKVIGVTSMRGAPIITDFKLLNESIHVGQEIEGRVILDEPLTSIKNIELEYDQGYITMEFVSLYYHNPDRVRYSYKLHGADQNFVLANENRSANYSGLRPGDYLFEVKASLNRDWSKATSTKVNISILPPPWRTWWAHTLYTLGVIGVVWSSLIFYSRRMSEEKMRELDEMKLQFFINVSHEFRTPLTLILNPVDKIISSFDKPEVVKYSAHQIQRSARKLLSLVNQLLDFRKMDLGKAPLDPIKGDIVSFTKDISKLFDDFSSEKSINFSFETSLDSMYMWFDPDKLEKIITNLISNALKFTPKGGYVSLQVNKKKISKIRSSVFGQDSLSESIEIVVSDTGIGLKNEQLSTVFDRFFHADSISTGTGIGLNFTKSLVEQHGGQISVTSEENKGTKFTVEIPCESKQMNDVLRSNQKSRTDIKEFDFNTIKSLEYDLAITDTDDIEDIESEVSNTNTQTVLIVEDNKELRLHLKNELQSKFKVKEAINGAEGLEKANKFYPDIVISDVMMPEMDGFEMCRSLKSSTDTCHIPIILLTARSLEEDRMEGYTIGADAYLPKPFNVHVLRARIKNLLESKKMLREKFLSQTSIGPSNELTTNTLDEKFLDEVTKIILDNVSDSNFGLEQLISEIGVSRSHFYRKINSLTGQNPSNFIRTIRLKYAAELLKNKTGSIKEIAYRSGFNSTAYFSKTFRELFEMTPNEFASES